MSKTQLEDKTLTIERACDLARVSRAGYYRAWEESEPRRAEAELRDRIQRLSLEYPQHGSRRIAKLLSAEGQAVNRKRVQRLMREDNLLVLRKRRYVVTTDARHTYERTSREPLDGEPLARANLSRTSREPLSLIRRDRDSDQSGRRLCHLDGLSLPF